MINDVKRRLPYYVDDWLAAFRPENHTTVIVSVVRIFFLNLMPALAYTLDMNDRTNGSYGVNEAILASALAAFVFSLFSVQPLTFVGITGLTNLMNYTIYDIFVERHGLDRIDYLRLQCWTLIWAAAFHCAVAIFNICDYTRFITDMTSETFGLYVGVVYVQKGIELLVRDFDENANGWLSVTIAILFCVTVYFVTLIGSSTYLPFRLRRIIGAMAFPAGCIFWSGFAHIPGKTLKSVPIARLPITKSFFPTLERGWLVDFWNINVKYVFIGAPLGLLVMLLFYFDHNVSSVMAQARKYPIHKPAGFHWDFFLLGITTFVSGILGLPAPNGLVPQAPDHTDSLAVYAQQQYVDEERRGPQINSVLHVTHVPRVHIERVVEQRTSHFAIALLTIGAMTRPILVSLGTMPRAVFAGVFLLVGWASIESNPIVLRTLSLLQDRSSLPFNATPLLQLRRRTIALFVGIQWLFFAATIAVTQTVAAIGFPVIIILMIPCRVYYVPRLFTKEELEILDAPTADAPGVMASLGFETSDLSRHTHESVRTEAERLGKSQREWRLEMERRKDKHEPGFRMGRVPSAPPRVNIVREPTPELPKMQSRKLPQHGILLNPSTVDEEDADSPVEGSRMIETFSLSRNSSTKHPRHSSDS
ncbi:hypothetical protein MCUN1_000479 [Malassezia cuniculi]|uniref:Bicarbonate transporter-like transmembrane domain-containing protein n=1 Tax=Malassezia cuniculi TaxID=948313 RepID=A0AAF0ENL8_9BASI|nr:hypothetical protein MCUN1_000479 [Malassezia cuniculi]